MSKRRNENGQMRREEYEANDSGEEVMEIGFQRASEDSIRKRKIVKARVGPRSSSTATQQSNNPFGGFQGLTASTAEKKNPFAAFAGLTSTTDSKPDPSKLGSFGTPQITSNLKATGSYEEAFAILNKEFHQFISEQKRENPSSSWNAAVEEYVKIASEISKKHPSSAPKTESTTPSFGTSATGHSTKLDDKSEGKVPFTGFSFGGNSATQSNEKSKESKPKAESSSFLPNTTTTMNAGFSFGALSSSKPDSTFLAGKGSSVGNLFSSETGTIVSGTKPFSFELGSSSNGVGKPSFGLGQSAATNSSSISNIADKGETKEEDDENIGREAATVILKVDNPDEDVRFEVEKAKIFEFKKDEKRWADKGVHPLKVLTNKSTSASRILVRNEIGKIVLNSAIYKGMSVKGHEMKGKQVGVIVPLQVGETMSQFLLKVKPENVDGLKRALESCSG